MGFLEKVVIMSQVALFKKQIADSFSGFIDLYLGDSVALYELSEHDL